LGTRAAALVFTTFALVAALAASQTAGVQPAAPLSLVSKEGRRSLGCWTAGGHEMVSLDELASIFQLAVQEDALAGGLTVAYRNRVIVLGRDQLASVGGRMVSLPAPPVKHGGRWLVPVDFIGRALALVYDGRLEVRRPSRLVIVGDVRIPRVNIAHESGGGQAHVTIDTTPPTPHTIVHERNRLLVRFDSEALDATLPAVSPHELLAGIRVVEPTTVAIELGPGFATYRAEASATESGARRLTVDLMPVRTEPLEAPPEVAPSPPPFMATPVSSIRTVVVDPGHGGEEDGAVGPGGTAEKDVTLAVARRLKSVIEARLGLRVLLTRDGDTAVPLDERAAIANNNKADLFVSLHANAAFRPGSTGAEVFYSNVRAYSEEAAMIGAGGGRLVAVHGGGARNIEAVLWDMAQAQYVSQSATLASLVAEELAARVSVAPRPVQQAPFRVLAGANMPAVLVEVGFLSNAEQEQQLTSPETQGQIVEGIYQAILRFRQYRDRPGAGPQSISRPGEAPGEVPSWR
jgi:N-acetylmuramoyl-L-alanine amidase